MDQRQHHVLVLQTDDILFRKLGYEGSRRSLPGRACIAGTVPLIPSRCGLRRSIRATDLRRIGTGSQSAAARQPAIDGSRLQARRQHPQTAGRPSFRDRVSGFFGQHYSHIPNRFRPICGGWASMPAPASSMQLNTSNGRTTSISISSAPTFPVRRHRGILYASFTGRKRPQPPAREIMAASPIRRRMP